METVYFLIFVGIFALVIVWGTGASRKKTDLASNRKTRLPKESSEKLVTPLDARLSHHREIWEERRNRAAKGYVEQTFVPKSAAKSAPEYDGYSRRDRHHLTPSGVVKQEKHIEDVDDFAIGGVKFKSGKHAAQS